MALLIFALLIGIPLIEIAIFIRVGGFIGGVATVLLTIFTASAGIWVVRLQGFGALTRFESEISRGRQLLAEILGMLLLLFAGLLLLIPGFLTDIIGGLLLLPPLRRALAEYAAQNAFFVRMGRRKDAAAAETIEGEYWEEAGEKKTAASRTLLPPEAKAKETKDE